MSCCVEVVGHNSVLHLFSMSKTFLMPDRNCLDKVACTHPYVRWSRQLAALAQHNAAITARRQCGVQNIKLDELGSSSIFRSIVTVGCAPDMVCERRCSYLRSYVLLGRSWVALFTPGIGILSAGQSYTVPYITYRTTLPSISFFLTMECVDGVYHARSHAPFLGTHIPNFPGLWGAHDI
jgi:hypothetical protein